MSKKFLGKVLASAALGGATLLIAPGIALAADGDHGAEWAGHDDKGGYSQCEWKDDKKDDKGKEEDKKHEDGKKDDDKKDDDKKCDSPKGWVDGGAAGTGLDAKLATTGGLLVGAAALGGLVLVRRRRTDGSVA